VRARLLLLSARLGAARFDAVIDRIEGEVAVLELPHAELCDVPVALLPSPAREGDRLRVRLGPRGTRVRLRRPLSPAPPGAPTPRPRAHPPGE